MISASRMTTVPLLGERSRGTPSLVCPPACCGRSHQTSSSRRREGRSSARRDTTLWAAESATKHSIREISYSSTWKITIKTKHLSPFQDSPRHSHHPFQEAPLEVPERIQQPQGEARGGSPAELDGGLCVVDVCSTRGVFSTFQCEFVDQVISGKTDRPWPAHSPDLAPNNFWLQGLCLQEILRVKPRTMEGIKELVTNFCGSLDREDVIAASQHLKKGQGVSQVQGGSF